MTKPARYSTAATLKKPSQMFAPDHVQELALLRQNMRILREEIDKKDAPVYWLEFFLLVAEMGEEGITTVDASEIIGITQGIASRIVKIFSRYPNPVTGKTEGYDLIVEARDSVYRQRQRVFLSEHGKKLIARIAGI